MVTLTRKLLTAFHFSCLGTDSDGNPVFVEDGVSNNPQDVPRVNAPDVIVKVYRDGSTDPLCRCLGEARLYCSAGDMQNGKCPYVSSPKIEEVKEDGANRRQQENYSPDQMLPEPAKPGDDESDLPF